VIGDPLRLQQVLLNLAGNALKFTAHGSVTLSVQIARETDQDLDIRCTVRDTGVGIEAEALRRIFDPFEQADGSTTRQFGGTGLGLTICNRLVRLMGGTLEVVSTPGTGSTFSFSLRFPMSEQERRPFRAHGGLRQRCGAAAANRLSRHPTVAGRRRPDDAGHGAGIAGRDDRFLGRSGS
jgi:K+-sensing histidine kinase KdpD